MAVFRVEKTRDYTIMSNHHFREKNMSLKAKGLLSLMLSLPEKWDYSIAGLVAICKENETSIKTALDELKEFGYLQVIKKMPNETKSGRIEYEYIVYEQKQEVQKQGVENLGVENPTQLNNNKVNTNIDYKYIVEYLNLRAKTNYRYQTPKTQALIRARCNEGYSIDDFKVVIDKKCNEWINTDMSQYLRPETLFGTKFEGYLNAKVKPNKQATKREYTKQELNDMFDNIEDINI